MHTDDRDQTFSTTTSSFSALSRPSQPASTVGDSFCGHCEGIIVLDPDNLCRVRD